MIALRGLFFNSILQKRCFTLLSFVKKNTVLIIALLAAGISILLVPPDKEYAGYIDFKTISCLYCVLAVVMALRDIEFFTYIARKIIVIAGSLRSAVLSIVYITFIGSMLIANDMALITFLPLGYIVLHRTNNDKHMAFMFIMQNIAANLGGMLTPFGNPQNLYLYTYYNIPTGQFMAVMLLPFLFAVALITLSCFIFIKKEKLTVDRFKPIHLPQRNTIIYLILFALSILLVFRFIPYILGVIVVTVALFIFDRHALAKVDYPLLFTFVAFFIFAGNLSRIEAVSNFISPLLNKNTLSASALSCQFMSNVPSAILLSQFTNNWKELLIGVNIGGTGTLIASLASLITFRQFSTYYPNKKASYFLKFTGINFAFLFLMIVFCSIQ